MDLTVSVSKIGHDDVYKLQGFYGNDNQRSVTKISINIPVFSRWPFWQIADRTAHVRNNKEKKNND